MVQTAEFAMLERTYACAACNRFVQELSAAVRQRQSELEEAFETTEVAEAEQRFDEAYSAKFRAWIDHRMTHDTGSLRKYVAAFRSNHQ